MPSEPWQAAIHRSDKKRWDWACLITIISLLKFSSPKRSIVVVPINLQFSVGWMLASTDSIDPTMYYFPAYWQHCFALHACSWLEKVTKFVCCLIFLGGGGMNGAWGCTCLSIVEPFGIVQQEDVRAASFPKQHNYQVVLTPGEKAYSSQQ